MLSICYDCMFDGKVVLIGCHVDTRTPKKIYCHELKCDRKCPNVPEDLRLCSTGLCQKHFEIAFKKSKVNYG